ncbi:hypothetical protein [Gordonia rubripertincta]|uniref:hypothetical protein n=1 Tax=Gordonia rubripertincta TaxID=36822 RepID=UPI0013C2EE42|nr:hypothetical protein [Gordonia rubripertincta]
MIPALITATAAIIVAIITGYVATRNARKAPHDALTALLDATNKSEKLSSSQRKVLVDAASSEVARIEAIYAAERRGWRASLLVRLRQGDPVFMVAAFFAVVAVVVAATTGIFVAQRDTATATSGSCVNSDVQPPVNQPFTTGSGIANVTRGDESYFPSTDAKADDVLKFSASYRKGVGSPAVNDLSLRISVTQQGEQATVTADFVGSGVNSTTSSSVTMSTPRANLSYVVSSARWCDGVLSEQLSLPDSIVTADGPQPFTNLASDNAYGGSVTVLLRSTAAVLSVRIECQTGQTQSWSQDCAVRPGESIATRLVLRNAGNLPIKSAVAHLMSDRFFSTSPGITVSTEPANDNDRASSGLLESVDGATLGDIAVGETLYAEVSATISPAAQRGETLVVKGDGRGLGMSAIQNVLSLRVQ